MNTGRLVVVLITGILGMSIIIGNWKGVIRARRTESSFSCIPFLGGIFTALSVAFTQFRAFFWVGFIVDIGTWSGLIGLPYLIKEILFRNKDE